MANLPLAFAELLVGGVLIDAGIKGASIGDVVKGQAGVASLSGAPAGSESGSDSSPGSAPAGAAVVGSVTQGQLTAIGAGHGWNATETAAWASIIKLESNGTVTDTNPSSGAYGIAQFINGPSEYATYGGDSTTVGGQLTAMANYIAQRYGTPSKALAFHLSNGWY